MRRARAAAAGKQFHRAALLYEQALATDPNSASLHVQCGHMLKEARKFSAAIAHYEAAAALLPNDPEIAFQMGHLFKVAGSPDEAALSYSRALELRPGWQEPEAELARLRATGWGGPDRVDAPIEILPADGVLVPPRDLALLAPELAPGAPGGPTGIARTGLVLRYLGLSEPGGWGEKRTLRGVEAIRGFCLSARPITDVEIVLNGITVHRSVPRGPYPLPHGTAEAEAKYVFNIWYDFASVPSGLHRIEVRAIDTDGLRHAVHEDVVVASPLNEADLPGSDAVISPAPGDARRIEAQIAERSSVIRAPFGRLFLDSPRTILVQRTDQLGDLVASVPALRRLREIFPGARIVGLLTEANAGLARSMSLFDEIIVIDFPDDPVEQHRIMPLDRQEALRARLAPYRFDIAIDLAQAATSRPLLRLSGARFLAGWGDTAHPWLSFGFDFNSHDPANRLDIIPHSSKILAMVEAIGAAMQSQQSVVRRADLDRKMLEPLGIGPDDQYVLLHAGARLAFSRWPYYGQLAEMILASTGMKIVLMTDHADMHAALPPALVRSTRFLFFDRPLEFDLFDALVSYAKVMVGNDSGPKHLAGLRGVAAITIFTARINWAEWGQEGPGSIISRKVPCAGCAIFHHPEECGRDFACIAGITPDEVLRAVKSHI